MRPPDPDLLRANALLAPFGCRLYRGRVEPLWLRTSTGKALLALSADRTRLERLPGNRTRVYRALSAEQERLVVSLALWLLGESEFPKEVA